MKNVRLAEMPISYRGKQYVLRCNMAVLYEVQNQYNGNLLKALYGLSEGRALRATATFLSCMMKEYAAEAGYCEDLSAQAVGKTIKIAGLKAIRPAISALVVTAFDFEQEKETETSPEEKGIDFEKYLTFWMTATARPEKEFWQTMTPARIVMIAKATNGKPEEKKARSLYEYMMGGV